jgi:hypothetical protein
VAATQAAAVASRPVIWMTKSRSESNKPYKVKRRHYS